jgi:hypothetical protein
LIMTKVARHAVAEQAFAMITRKAAPGSATQGKAGAVPLVVAGLAFDLAGYPRRKRAVQRAFATGEGAGMREDAGPFVGFDGADGAGGAS